MTGAEKTCTHCAASMPIDAEVCTDCGINFGVSSGIPMVRMSSPFEGLGIVVLIVLGVLIVLAVGGFWFVSGMNIE